jgi:hypothetical protein
VYESESFTYLVRITIEKPRQAEIATNISAGNLVQHSSQTPVGYRVAMTGASVAGAEQAMYQIISGIFLEQAPSALYTSCEYMIGFKVTDSLTALTIETKSLTKIRPSESR